MRRAASLLLLVLLVSLPVSASSHPPATVRVEMTEFTFRPATIRLKMGEPVRLQFVNRGQIAHQFESDLLRKVPVQITDEHSYVEAPGLDILRLAPGASARLEFVVRSGTRARFNCTIEGHREAGMSGVIEIR